MSGNSKLIELIAIKQINDHWHLHTRIISIGNQLEVIWEVDDFTSNHLSALCEFSGNHKFRLALQTSVDSSNTQITSSVVKTFRDSSKRINFLCSTEYKKQLEDVKNTPEDDLLKLPFLRSLNIELQENNDSIKKAKFKNPNRTIKWASISLISAVFLLFGYSTFLNKNDSGNLATDELKKAEAHLVEASVTAPATAPTIPETVEPPEQIYFPSAKMDELINFSISGNNVAITFDDGPSKFTTAIVDILKSKNAGGTFFFIGNNATKHPGAVQYVHANGYSIGSHSLAHDNMVKLTYAQQEQDMLQTMSILENLIDEKVNLYRPPYGSYNDSTEEIALSHDQKLVFWDKDTKDWQTRDAQKIIHYVKSIDATSSIILLHESQAVVDALPSIIDHLQQQGLNIVNLQ